MWSWKTVFFPTEMPHGFSPWHYVFGSNKTHVALALGYGSISNHHEFANVINVWNDESETNVVFAVSELLHLHICISTFAPTKFHVLHMSRPQGTSKLERKFSCPTATIGLKTNTSRMSPWTLHSPGGDQNSRRFRVANPLFKKPPAATAQSAIPS